MTTDPFITAAEEAAERSRDEVLGGPWNGQYDANYILGFEAGAEWARDHLAAQEPSDAEVEAMWDAISQLGATRWGMRKGMSAARTARRDEESS